MKNKNSLIIVGVIVVVLVLIVSTFAGTYNKFVSLEENVETQEAAIDVALERRADLIPNLVSTVKGYAKHEEKVINDITSARQNLMQAKGIDEKSAANDKLTSAINALMVVVENYPDLKANTNFINLQDELAGTENRIATARKDYNDSVKQYNTSIKKFPGNMVANMFGFDKKEYFEVSEKKAEVPNVDFE